MFMRDDDDVGTLLLSNSTNHFLCMSLTNHTRGYKYVHLLQAGIIWMIQDLYHTKSASNSVTQKLNPSM